MNKINNKLHLLYTIPNFDTAGSGKVVYDLARNIDKTKFKVSIVCNHNRGAFFNEIESLGWPIYLRSFTTSIRPYLSLYQRVKPFARFLKEEKVDIVHSWHWSSDWTEALACKIAKVPFVYTKKSMGWGNRHWKIKSYLSRFIITVNPAMNSFFKQKKNVKLIPFGIDTSSYNPDHFNQTKGQVFTIITVANLVAVKNIEFIIRAIAKMEDLDIRFNILGDTRSTYADQLKKQVIDLKLQSKISFLGKHEDVRPFLAESDLFIISSLKEGMPVALMEAMTMGVPVLGSNIDGISYVLQNFKELIFDLSDLDSLIEKIKLFFTKSASEREEIGSKLRNYCLNNFSMELFIERHEELYQKIGE